MQTLYVSRTVNNPNALIAWAEQNGIKPLSKDDLHVTLAFSKQKFDVSNLSPERDKLLVENDKRTLLFLGEDKKALVLKIQSDELSARHEEFKAAGASWNWPSYQPHITISYDASDIDLKKIVPFSEKIEFGKEIFAEIDEEWKNKLQKFETFSKVDESLGLVFGWAIVSKQNGEDYWDLQKEHIPEAAMLEAATDFMINSRASKDMHKGKSIGNVVFAFPLTTEIAKSLNIETKQTGLLIAIKPDSDDILQKYKTGEYSGFSIGGFCEKGETID